MTPEFAEAAAQLASLLLTYWLHSTLAIAVVWLATRGRKSSTMHEQLWKFAAVVGLITAPLQVYWPHSPGRIALRPAIEDGPATASPRPSPPKLDAPADELAQITRPGARLPQANVAAPRTPESVETIRPSDFESQPLNVVRALRDRPLEPPITVPVEVADHEEAALSIGPESARKRLESLWSVVGWTLALLPLVTFSCGMALVAMRLEFLRRRTSTAKPLRGAARRQLDTLLKTNRIERQVNLLSSDQYPEPVAFGLWRWTIVLPTGIEQRLDNAEIRALLAHEIAHLVRGDIAWLWVGQWLCLCLPFQPLNFLARRRWQSASEFLCDQWAIRAGVDGLVLAKSLTEVAEWRMTRRCQVSLAASGDSQSTVARIERLVDGPANVDRWANRRGRIVLLGLMTLSAILILTLSPRFAVPIAGAPIQRANAAESRMDLAKDLLGLKQVDSELEAVANVSSVDEELHRLDEELGQLNRLLADSPLHDEERLVAERIAHRAQKLRTLRDRLVDAKRNE